MSKHRGKQRHQPAPISRPAAQPAVKAPGTVQTASAPEVEAKDYGLADAFDETTGGWTTLLGGGGYGRSHSGVEVTPITSLGVSAVYASVRILAGDLAKLPIRLLRVKDGIEVPDLEHPMARLMKRPNPRMTPFELKSALVTSLLLTGNSYAATVPGANGRVGEIIPVIPTMVSVSEGHDGKIYYRVGHRMLPDQYETYSEEELVHVRNFSLDGGLRGASPIQVAAEAMGVALATQQHAARTFQNGASFDGVLMSDLKLSKEAVEQTSNAWNNRQGGVHNAGKVPLLHSGVRFEKIGMSPEDAQLIDSRQFGIAEVSRIYGVPMHKLGSLDKASFASIDAQNQEYIDSTLIPLACPIEEALGKVLLLDHEQDLYRFAFDFSLLERGDIATQTAQWHTFLTDGVYSVNEVRALMNKPGIGPEGDIRTKPMNTGVVGDTQGLPQYQIDGPKKETEEEAPEGTEDNA